MSEQTPTPLEKEAAAWLLLAYSLEHSDGCNCSKCRQARSILAKAKKGGENAA